MPSAIEALKYWKQTDDKKYKKVKKMLEQICAMPKTGIGKPEPLKHELTGLWSRRIDRANRLVYSFDDEYAYLWQARCKIFVSKKSCNILYIIIKLNFVPALVRTFIEFELGQI